MEANEMLFGERRLRSDPANEHQQQDGDEKNVFGLVLLLSLLLLFSVSCCFLICTLLLFRSLLGEEQRSILLLF